MDRINIIKDYINKSTETKQKILNDKNSIEKIEQVANTIVKTYRNGGKVLTAGNGGSAGDAQHIASELVSRFNFERSALSAFSLATDTSLMTAIGNDYDFSKIFARQIEANAKKGDVFIGISTSGNSKNVVNAVIAAKKIGVITVGLVGQNSCLMDELCDYLIKVPSTTTSIIQESHVMLAHIICGLVEKDLFEKK